MFRQRGPAQLQQTAPKGTTPGAGAAVLPPGSHKRLGDMLVEEGVVSESNLQEAIEIQRSRGGFLGKLLVELGYTTQDDVVSCLVKQCKIPHLNLQDYDIDTNVFQLVSEEVCREHNLVPIDKLGRILTIAMVDPLNAEAIDTVRRLCPQLRIKPILCSWQDYETVLNKMSASPRQSSYEAEPLGTYVPKALGAESALVKKEVEALPIVGTYVPKPLNPEGAPASAATPALDPLDTSQSIQRAGRSRTRAVEESVPAESPEEDSIGEDVLREIVVSAVNEALGDIRRQLAEIQNILKSRPRGGGATRATDPQTDTFKDIAQSMRRSFGLDLKEETPAVSQGAQEQDEDIDGVFGGLKISAPMECHTFDNFFGGNANDFTFAVCKKVASQPGVEYNPLYLYGAVGAGKTHLANAIGNAMLAQNPDLRIGYLPAAQFLERMEQAIRFGQLEAFRAHYAPWNALIFDDIDQIAGHHAAQEELMHLVDTLVRRGCHLIVAGGALPDKIGGIESRLKSRLNSGLTAEVKAPDAEGRRAMLRDMIGRDQVALPESVVELIVELAGEDVRAMRGCLHKAAAVKKLGGADAGAEGLAEQVRHLLAPTPA